MIEIDRYITELGPNRTILYYAVKGKTKYPMPSCYSMMYDDEHLAIEDVSRPDIDLYDSLKHYIPLRHTKVVKE